MANLFKVKEITMKFTDYLFKVELTESEVKYQALEEMKNIQATLGSISFISVIGVMREDNPLKEEVFKFEDQLHELTVEVSKFINDNLADAVPITDDERAQEVDGAVAAAEDQDEIEKRSPQPKEEK